MPPHTASSFDHDFDHLRQGIGRMADVVESQWNIALGCLREPDDARVAQVLHAEVEVNQLQVHIDRMCNQLIVRFQPIAIDLREAVSILHMVSDLERVGDEAKKSATRLNRAGFDADPQLQASLASMADEAVSMLHDAVQAYLRLDDGAHAALTVRDTSLGQACSALTQQLLARLLAEPSKAAFCLDLIFVARSIERVGDHAKNIARYVVSVVHGIDRRAAGRDDSLRPFEVAAAPQGLRDAAADCPIVTAGPAG